MMRSSSRCCTRAIASASCTPASSATRRYGRGSIGKLPCIRLSRRLSSSSNGIAAPYLRLRVFSPARPGAVSAMPSAGTGGTGVSLSFVVAVSCGVGIELFVRWTSGTKYGRYPYTTFRLYSGMAQKITIAHRVILLRHVMDPSGQPTKTRPQRIQLLGCITDLRYRTTIAHRAAPRVAPRLAPIGQPTRRILGVIGDHYVSPRAVQRRQDLADGGTLGQHSGCRGSLDHRILATHVVHRKRQGSRVLDSPNQVAVSQSRLDHQHVSPLFGVQQRLAHGFAPVGRIQLVAATVAESRR